MLQNGPGSSHCTSHLVLTFMTTAELEFVFILALPVKWSEHLESMQVQFLCSWDVVKVKGK